MTEAQKKEIHQLYLMAYNICQRAIKQGKNYIGFQNSKKRGFGLVVSSDNYNGRSSRRVGPGVSDWATNVLYRLQDEKFIDLPLDEYFNELDRVGYK